MTADKRFDSMISCWKKGSLWVPFSEFPEKEAAQYSEAAKRNKVQSLAIMFLFRYVRSLRRQLAKRA